MKNAYPGLIPAILLFCFSSVIHAQSTQENPTQESSWTCKTDMPTARLGLATAVVNDQIYAIGGYAAANHPGMTVNEVYDPVSDTWDTKARMPTGRRGITASTVNDKIYVFGGYTNFGQPGLPVVEEYDPASDTWSSKTDIPTPRLGPASCVVDGIIYVIGGAIQGFDVGHPGVKKLMEYNPLKE